MGKFKDMKKIKDIIKVLIWPIILMVGQFFINYIFVIIFNNNLKMNNQELLNYMKTKEYNILLNEYINSKTLIIIFIITIIFIPLFYQLYKKYKVKQNKKLNVLEPILLGISVSLTYNIIVFYLNTIFSFTNQFELSNLSIISQIISSGIIGPIIEELVFRGIVYNSLKESNTKSFSIIITTLLFSIIHFNIINSIYTIFVGLLLIYLYEKYKTLKAPIIMHISLNTTIILLLPIIIKNYVALNIYLLVASISILCIYIYRCIK